MWQRAPRQLLSFWASFILCVAVLVSVGPAPIPARSAPMHDEPMPPDQAFLEDVARATWGYLGSEWATANHLPRSWRSPELEGGDYANPAEIGLYMVASLGAFELRRDWSPDWDTTAAEVGAILDQLQAWQSGSQPAPANRPNAHPRGVFYQNYWLSHDPPRVADLPRAHRDRQTPSVDNAWLALSLLTVREYAQAWGHTELARKADAIVQRMDFRLWYHPSTHLFSWLAPGDAGYGAMADDYSSESRIIPFVARALGQLSEAEFAASLAVLGRAAGSYDRGTPDAADDIIVGRANWDGSYFAYLTPSLFWRELATSYGRDTIDPATGAQIAYARDQGYPAWGISDAFGSLHSDYLERGAPPRRSGNPCDDEDDGLIAPHASALALITAHADEAVSNLRALRTNFPDLYDPTYGFKDSVNLRTLQVSSRFSALSQLWIMLSLLQVLGDGVIWQYFYQDEGVQQTHAELERSLGTR